MIAYFPQIYPDELIYSQLARYYAHTGYLAYTFAAQDLYENKAVRPDIYFVNKFSPDALRMITHSQSMQDIVMYHTMFPYYGRFINRERRQKAFDSLVNMAGNYHNLMAIPKSKYGTQRYLRYCPICADADRSQNGETYWHRIHQMIGVNICPLHFCYLINSNVILSGKASPALITAEESVPPSSGIIISGNRIERRIAVYIASVFKSEVDMLSDVTPGQFLYAKMAGTKYRSIRGEQRNISLFHSDFSEYYRNLYCNWFTELWQIQKVLADDRINTFEICLMAMFLDIPATELSHMVLPSKTQQQIFDDQVFKLHEQGLNYAEIARKLHGSYETVKAIGERRYGTYHKAKGTAVKPGAKQIDWAKLDDALLPLVKQAIYQLHGNSLTRPRRVTMSSVEKLLHLPSKQINNLPKCKAEIQQNYESQEQYWAREVVWAVNTILSDGTDPNITAIRRITNMRKSYIVACLPYISKYCDTDTVRIIMSIV